MHVCDGLVVLTDFVVRAYDSHPGGKISGIVRKAIKRAGVSAPRTGAHVLRHSLATAMLRRGASLDEIGQILRHRDVDTTAIYAKVDLDALRPLALAWPGGAQ